MRCLLCSATKPIVTNAQRQEGRRKKRSTWGWRGGRRGNYDEK